MTDETTDQASEDTTRTITDAAGLKWPSEGVDPDSPAPRLSFSPASRPSLDEMRDEAKRALLKRMAEMADGGDLDRIEHVAAALHVVELA